MSFDDILQLRAEPEFKSGRDASRGWIRNVSSKGWSDKELRQEIHHLLHQYREYMSIQKIKYSLTTLSCLAKLPAHIAGTFIGTIPALVTTGCSLFITRINLMEAELKAPGRELAYIDSLNKRICNYQ